VCWFIIDSCFWSHGGSGLGRVVRAAKAILQRSSIHSAPSRRGWARRTFLMKTLPKVASEMALSVLAYNLTRILNIAGVKALMAAIKA
jgi:hypothetical protein